MEILMTSCASLSPAMRGGAAAGRDQPVSGPQTYSCSCSPRPPVFPTAVPSPSPSAAGWSALACSSTPSEGRAGLACSPLPPPSPPLADVASSLSAAAASPWPGPPTVPPSVPGPVPVPSPPPAAVNASAAPSVDSAIGTVVEPSPRADSGGPRGVQAPGKAPSWTKVPTTAVVPPSAAANTVAVASTRPSAEIAALIPTAHPPGGPAGVRAAPIGAHSRVAVMRTSPWTSLCCDQGVRPLRSRRTRSCAALASASA